MKKTPLFLAGGHGGTAPIQANLVGNEKRPNHVKKNHNDRTEMAYQSVVHRPYHYRKSIPNHDFRLFYSGIAQLCKTFSKFAQSLYKAMPAIAKRTRLLVIQKHEQVHPSHIAVGIHAADAATYRVV